jgi:tetratricopeptide (TPR) repeat protein
MTAIRPNLLKLLAPLATFGLTVALLLALNGPRDIALPERTPLSYVSLGYDYLQKARDNGDPTNYSRAERSFDAALRRDARDIDALLGAATLAGLRHNFPEQLRLGFKARGLMPESVAAYPEIADAQIELGRYGAAERTLQRMIDLRPNLSAYARISYYRELGGDLDGAVETMRLAVSAGGGAPENVAYVQALLGDLELQRGQVRAARLAYVAALRSLPGYPAGLVGLARADAAGGDLGRAAVRLRRAAERLPRTSTLLLLADVERTLGKRDEAGAALAAVKAQQRLYRQARTLPDAEAVLAEADHGSPARAVRLGRRVWDAAPSVRSADALGWALTRAKRPRAGYAFARRALRLGSRDPLFNLHAGVAARRSGLRGEAERYLTTAAKGASALPPAAVRLLQEVRS